MYCFNCQGVYHDALQSECSDCGASLIVKGYRAVGLLNSQPMSPVFEVVSPDGEHKVARLVREPERIQYFQDIEMGLRLISQQYDYPVCPAVIDTFMWEFNAEASPYFILLEKIEGITLKEYVETHDVNDEQVMKWMLQLFNMLGLFHEQSWLLRDVKPENIVVNPDGRLIFVDIDSLFHWSWGQDSHLLHLNSPGYSAPEQNDGRPLPDSDVFSLGRTAIFCLTGRSPVELYGDNGFEWRSKLKKSLLLLDFVERLVALNPIDRPRVQDSINYLKLLPARIRRKSRWQKYKWPVTVVLGVAALGIIIPLEKRLTSWRYRIQADQQQLVGNVESANVLYERSLQSDPRNASAHMGVGMTCMDQSCAIESLETALSLQPDDDLILYNLAALYEDVDPQRALQLYESISSDSNRYLLAQNNVARLAIQQGYYDQALVILDTIIERKNNGTVDSTLLAQAYKNQGLAYIQSGEEQKAMESLDQSLSLNPLPGDAYCLRAMVALSSADLVSCFSLDSGSPEAKRLKTQLFSEVLGDDL